MNIKSVIVLLLTAFVFASCFYGVDYLRFSEKEYTPTSNVDVYNVKPVDKPFVEMGRLSVKIRRGLFGNQETAVLELKERAKEIGADAIIILGENTKSIASSDSDGSVTVSETTRLRAVAIKYLKE